MFGVGVFGWHAGRMDPFRRCAAGLEELRKADRFRDRRGVGLRASVERRAEGLGVPFVDVSSNDYLGLGRQVDGGGGLGCVSRETFCEVGGPIAVPNAFESVAGDSDDGGLVRAGAGSSRLAGGTFEAHGALEAELSDWLGRESALVFSSGFAANIGVVGSLSLRGDVVFSDGLNHASLVDGCRLGGGRVVVFPHRDLVALREVLRSTPVDGQRWVVSETYFSMDGDSPDLVGLADLCREFECGLVLDEAHAIGVFGDGGRGLAPGLGVQADVVLAGLGKACGVQGGVAAAPGVAIDWFWNRARSFVFSTASSPLLARRQLFHVKQARSADAARRRLGELTERVRTSLRTLGLQVPAPSHGPIIPILLGTDARAVAYATALQELGILVYPIRPPTVPAGTARLRVTLNASMEDTHVDHLLTALADCRAL